MMYLPTVALLSPARWGFRTSTPFFIARAATSISGTKISLFLNFSPTTPIASIIPTFKISNGSQPSLIASSTRPPITLAFPASTAAAISCTLDMIKILLLFWCRIRHVLTLFSFPQTVRSSSGQPSI